MIDFNMTLQQAIDAPKIAFQEPSELAVEEGIPTVIQNGLKTKGHHVVTDDVRIGNAHGIRIIRNEKGDIKDVEVAADKRWKFK